MPTLQNCLRLIAEAKASARAPESAYVLRARLKRSLLGASQLAAVYAGVTEPSMPEDIERLSPQEPAAAEILRICVSLLAGTRSLCQPSEALDSRWRSGWADMCQNLDLLEHTLLSLRTEGQDERIGAHIVSPGAEARR